MDEWDTVTFPPAINQFHVEGVVSDVFCGYPLPYSEDQDARRSVSVISPALATAQGMVQMWLRVPEDENTASDVEAVPLAVRSPLTEGCLRALCMEHGDIEPGADVTSMLTRLEAVLRRELFHRRLVISGQLRLEQRYDGDAGRTVAVPYLSLPMDGLRRSYWLL